MVAPGEGFRVDSFRRHSKREHQSSNTPDGYELYNPWPLVDKIVEGSISMEDAKQRAIANVEEKALMLGKQEVLEDPWGRKGKIGSQC